MRKVGLMILVHSKELSVLLLRYLVRLFLKCYIHKHFLNGIHIDNFYERFNCVVQNGGSMEGGSEGDLE
jgi:hypothetical protein